MPQPQVMPRARSVHAKKQITPRGAASEAELDSLLGEGQAAPASDPDSDNYERGRLVG